MRTRTSNRGLSRQHGIMAVVLLILLSHFSTGFVMPSTPSTAASRRKILQSHHRLRPQQWPAYMSNSNDDEDEEEEEEEYEYEREPVLVSDVRGRPAGVVLDDLNWRVQRLKLEEANTRRFLKSGPRFLPYEECRKWVQAWGLRWTTAEEWREWIESGEKRNSYIPSRPDEYFSRTGHWISWEDFLGVPSKDEENGD